MKKTSLFYIADEGKRFALTHRGFEKTPANVKPERHVGGSVKGFETKVPISWVNKGYVKEV